MICSGAAHNRSRNGRRVECRKSKSLVSSACAISRDFFAARSSLHVYRRSSEPRMRGLENGRSSKSSRAMGLTRSTVILAGSFRTRLHENRVSPGSLFSCCRSGLERSVRYDVLTSGGRTLESAGHVWCALSQCHRVSRSGKCSRSSCKARYTAFRFTAGVSTAARNVHGCQNRCMRRHDIAWDCRCRLCRIVSIRRILGCMSVRRCRGA